MAACECFFFVIFLILILKRVALILLIPINVMLFLFHFSILVFSDNVTMEFPGRYEPLFQGTKVGRIYLTSHRMIFNNKIASDPLVSFSFPFVSLNDVSHSCYFSSDFTNKCYHFKKTGSNRTASLWSEFHQGKSGLPREWQLSRGGTF